MAWKPGKGGKADTSGATNYLRDLRKGLPRVVTVADIQVGNILVQNLRKLVPADTGALKASIRVLGYSKRTRELGAGREVKVGFANKAQYTFPVNARNKFIDKAIAETAEKAVVIYDNAVRSRARKGR